MACNGGYAGHGVSADVRHRCACYGALTRRFSLARHGQLVGMAVCSVSVLIDGIRTLADVQLVAAVGPDCWLLGCMGGCRRQWGGMYGVNGVACIVEDSFVPDVFLYSFATAM
jgi:predicted Co/Zn/Cd cation transporter (cation efflux family)